MNHCKTCKHWTHPKVIVRPREKGLCTLFSDAGDAGIVYDKPPHKLVDLFPDDGYGCAMETDECFGCVAHESKAGE